MGSILSTANGQTPIIKASSKIVDVRDGLNFKKGGWYIMPEKKPDVYYVEIPRKEHTVTFFTDTDSISIETKFGGQYDFIILLNNKDSCHTRIIANYKAILPYVSNHSSPDSDTIPFKVGDNSKIYLTGQLNGSAPLNIQFDLGNSGAPIIKKASIAKTQIHFDDSITLQNSDGTNVVPFSRKNKLTIAGLTWDSVPVAVADNMTYRDDIVAGNFLFQDKIVEINYDRKIIVIHDSLPPLDITYTRHDMVLSGGVIPYLRAILFFNAKKYEGWFLFDTGAYTSIIDNEIIPASNKMIAEGKKMIGMNIRNMQPSLSIGNYQLTGFNYTTQQQNTKNFIGLLGNDVMKRFNVIVDSKNGYLYLQPNSLTSEPYANPEFYVVRFIAGLLLIVIAVVVLFRHRKKRKKKNA